MFGKILGCSKIWVSHSNGSNANTIWFQACLTDIIANSIRECNSESDADHFGNYCFSSKNQKHIIKTLLKLLTSNYFQNIVESPIPNACAYESGNRMSKMY